MIHAKCFFYLLGVVLMLIGCLPPKPPDNGPVGEATLSVREADWDLDTNLDVFTTDRLVISASGQIWAGVLLIGNNGPNGWTNIDNDPKFPLPGSHPYCLLGKVGTRYFFIGDGAQVNLPIANGRLWLRINDDLPGNGSGAFTVHVQVWRK